MHSGILKVTHWVLLREQSWAEKMEKKWVQRWGFRLGWCWGKHLDCHLEIHWGFHWVKQTGIGWGLVSPTVACWEILMGRGTQKVQHLD